MPSWRREFGEEYDVPGELQDTARWTDTSWHNDSCPSFIAAGYYDRMMVCDPNISTRPQMTELRLWVEHPDPAMREFDDVMRYTVTEGQSCATTLTTDDLDEALREYRERLVQLDLMADGHCVSRMVEGGYFCTTHQRLNPGDHCPAD